MIFMNKICLKWNSVFTVGRSKKNELATNENGIHISLLTKNNKRNLHISPRSSLTAGLIFMN
jgi:hypothetical protein